MSSDDWEYTRTRQQHFTEAEKAFIRAGYKANRSAKDVARDLKCSSRVIQTHFANLACEIPVRDRDKKPAKPNYYRSTFEPS